jgi:surface antigen
MTIFKMQHLKIKWRAMATLLFVLMLSAPAIAGDNEFAGTLLGAGVGGLIGNQFGHGTGRVASTGVGVFLGGLVGNDIGHDLDRREVISYANPYPGSYASGYEYQTPGSATYGASYVPNYVGPDTQPPTQPMIYVDDAADSYCREYSETVRIGDHLQETFGTACLQPDGTWRVAQ